MPTLVFDFDSTLISCESLEEILRPQLQDSDERLQQIQDLTQEAMNGQLAFREALERRLAIAAPTRQDVQAFGEKALDFLTTGIVSLIQDLHSAGIATWVVSGGLREALLPTCHHLGIPDAQLHAVCPLWHPDGRFQKLDPHDPSADSKVAAVRSFSKQWSSPVIGVGDGMTDYALYEAGLVDHFIVYAEHVQRTNVLAIGAPIAYDAEELRQRIKELLQNHAPSL